MKKGKNQTFETQKLSWRILNENYLSWEHCGTFMVCFWLHLKEQVTPLEMKRHAKVTPSIPRGTFFERSCFTSFFFSCCLKFFSTRIWFYWHNVTGFNQKLISCFFRMVNIQLSTQSLKLLKKKLVWWLLKMKKLIQ